MSRHCKHIAIAVTILSFLTVIAQAQTPVSIITPPKFQSFLNNGSPNAFGCVWTYQNLTTTPLASYTDGSGVTLNPNPVPLDASGSANIWLIQGDEYSVVVKTAGGINCSAGSTLVTANYINQSLLNNSNTWQQTQYFLKPIYLEPSDLQIIFGWPSGTQTTLDIPPTSSNLILHGPIITADDTLVSENATQDLTNKNLTTGTEVNGCGMINGPATYICVANNATTPTILNSLTMFTGAPSTATVAPTSAITGVQGIVVENAGVTGTAVIQQTGTASCNFDGATIAGDYVQISTSVAGDCHDSGFAPPLIAPGGTQLIGIVLSTNSGSGAYTIALSAYGSAIGAYTIFADGTPTVVGANVLTPQVLKTTSFAAGALNTVGASFRASGQIATTMASSASQTLFFQAGPTAALADINAVQFYAYPSSTLGIVSFHITCTVTTMGATGTITCVPEVTVDGNTGGTVDTAAQVITADLTAQLYVGNTCVLTYTTGTNTCTQNLLVVERLK